MTAHLSAAFSSLVPYTPSLPVDCPLPPHSVSTSFKYQWQLVTRQRETSSQLRSNKKFDIRSTRSSGRMESSPYRPHIVSGLYLHLSNCDLSFQLMHWLLLSGLPQAREKVRGPDRAREDGRASS